MSCCDGVLSFNTFLSVHGMKPKHFYVCLYVSMLEVLLLSLPFTTAITVLQSSLSAGVTVCFVLALQWMRVESNRPRTPVQTQGSQKTANASAMTLGNHLCILGALSSTSTKLSLTQTYWPLYLVHLSHIHSIVSKSRHIEGSLQCKSKKPLVQKWLNLWIQVVVPQGTYSTTNTFKCILNSEHTHRKHTSNSCL